MKKCSKCKSQKPLIEFTSDKSRGDGYSYTCKACQRKRWRSYSGARSQTVTNYRARMRSIADTIKANQGCCVVDCIETDPVSLDFHHRLGVKKAFEVSTYISRCRPGPKCEEKLRLEIAKCEVICANHHRQQHAGRTLSFKVGRLLTSVPAENGLSLQAAIPLRHGL